MTTHFDPSNDFEKIIDNAESVTLLRRGATSGESGEIIPHALRRTVSLSEPLAGARDEVQSNLDSSGKAVAFDTTWHLLASELSKPPSLGDVILDGPGRRWTIIEMQLVVLRSRWRCLARELSIAHGLDDTITILQADYSQSSSDLAWRVWRSGVRASIQPVQTTIKITSSSRSSTASYQIFPEEELTLDHNHRLRAADGALFEITSVKNATKLGELQTIEAVKLSGG
jgi:hypothetical protein